jgi:hypothetical protein
MKKYTIGIIAFLFFISLSSFFIVEDVPSRQMISFNVRGNGKTNLTLGIGYQVGSGACCRGVSKESTVGFQGNPGDVLYESDSRKVILKVTKDMQGKTIDLREYY